MNQPTPPTAPAAPTRALATQGEVLPAPTAADLRTMKATDFTKIGITEVTDQNKFATLVASDEDMAKRVFAILASRPKGKEVPLALAIGCYFYELANPDERLDRDFFLDKTMGIVPSYQGVAKQSQRRGVGTVDYDYRPMTADEKDEMDIEEGDSGIVCIATQVEVKAKMELLHQTYHPILGFGIVKNKDKWTDEKWEGWGDNRRKVKLPAPIKVELSGGYTWGRKARNRAKKDADRHIPGMPQSNVEFIEDFLDRVGQDALPGDIDTLESLPTERLRTLLESAERQAQTLTPTVKAAAAEGYAEDQDTRRRAANEGIDFDHQEPAAAEPAPESTDEPLPADLAAIEPIRLKLNQFGHLNTPATAEMQAKIEEMLTALESDESLRLAFAAWAWSESTATEGVYRALFDWLRPTRQLKTKQIQFQLQDALQDYDRIAAVLKARAAALANQEEPGSATEEQPELF